MAKARTRTVKLEEIVIDPRAQTRDGIDADHIAEMDATLAEGGELPPPLCVEVDGNLILADGFHRVETHRRRKTIRLAVLVIVGTEDDWIAAWAAANDEQKGKPRTRAAKRKSVVQVLAMRPKWSNPRIAEVAKVSVEFVRKLRPGKDGETRETSDGKQRPGTLATPILSATLQTENPADSSQPTVASSDAAKSTESDPPAKGEENAPAAAGEDTPADIDVRGSFSFGGNATPPAEDPKPTKPGYYLERPAKPKPNDTWPAAHAVNPAGNRFHPRIIRCLSGSDGVIDAYGQAVPAGAGDYFDEPALPELRRLIAQARALNADIRKRTSNYSRNTTGNRWFDPNPIFIACEANDAAFGAADEAVHNALLFVLCWGCHGHPVTAERKVCKVCRSMGAVPEYYADAHPDKLPKLKRETPTA